MRRHMRAGNMCGDISNLQGTFRILWCTSFGGFTPRSCRRFAKRDFWGKSRRVSGSTEHPSMSSTKFLKFSNVTKRGHAILSYVKKSNGLREHSLIPRCSVIIFYISQKESQLKGEISIEKNKKSLHILVDHPLAKNLSHAEIWIMFLSTSASRIFDETMF